jgi:hypothetical protein
VLQEWQQVLQLVVPLPPVQQVPTAFRCQGQRLRQFTGPASELRLMRQTLPLPLPFWREKEGLRHRPVCRMQKQPEKQM